MIFLRNIRTTFITIVSIPLSLCFTLFLLSWSGVTLNILTLGGVAVAVGRLVDDSIVVIENIFRKMQTEKFSVQMVIDATKQVGVAITASTLNNSSRFLTDEFIKRWTSRIPFTIRFNGYLFLACFFARRFDCCSVNECGIIEEYKDSRSINQLFVFQKL